MVCQAGSNSILDLMARDVSVTAEALARVTIAFGDSVSSPIGTKTFSDQKRTGGEKPERAVIFAASFDFLQSFKSCHNLPGYLAQRPVIHDGVSHSRIHG